MLHAGLQGQPIRDAGHGATAAAARGHTLGAFDEICDGYIINTCTVTAVSDKKSRNAIRRARKLNPARRRRRVRLLRPDQPGGGPQAGRRRARRHRRTAMAFLYLAAGLEARLPTRQKWEQRGRRGSAATLRASCPPAGLPRGTRALAEGRGRLQQFLHLLHHPLRPRPRALHAAARPPSEQAKGLAAEGYREIVINGIEISSWGWEWKDGSRPAASCWRRSARPLPAVRIRLGSLEPRTIDEDFCTTLCGLPQPLPASST